MQTRTLVLAIASIFMITITSCVKDPIPAPVTSALDLVFTQNSMPIASVDSVVVRFEKPNTATVSKKMIAQNTKYSLPAAELPSGEYDVTFFVYNKKLQPGIGYSYVYRLTKKFSLPAAASLDAPAGKYTDGDWLPSLLFHNAAHNVSLIIAEKNDDPYFEVRAPQGLPYKQAYLDRAAFGGGNTAYFLVDEHNWLPLNNPVANGSFVNTTVFKDYSERMKTKDWVRTDIFFLLDMGNDQEVEFDHSYYKRP